MMGAQGCTAMAVMFAGPDGANSPSPSSSNGGGDGAAPARADADGSAAQAPRRPREPCVTVAVADVPEALARLVVEEADAVLVVRHD